MARSRAVGLASCLCILVAGAAVFGGSAAAFRSDAASATSYVSPHGSPGAANTSCGTAAFASIAAAVAAAPTAGTVVVCPGTYHEDVVVAKPLTLVGQGHATVDAAHLENAVQVVSSHVVIRGLTLENANGEGVLVGVDSPADTNLIAGGPMITSVTIDHVRAINNDRGFNGTENGNCTYPGDCGGGIHLEVVESSTVSNSVVNGNADGILVTDDYGPAAHNLIVGNIVSYNSTECGIVLPGHNPGAVGFNPVTMAVTGRHPAVAGVFDNAVIGNVTIANGTAVAPPQFGGVGGSGGGVGIFGSGPGTGAYDNLVQGNYMAGNGIAGFTIHAHHPGGEDVNGNAVVGNVFSTNNVTGDAFDGGIMNFATTAIAVYSVPPVQMTIAHNVIHDNAIGIWLTDTVTAAGLATNTFVNVATPVVVQPAN